MKSSAAEPGQGFETAPWLTAAHYKIKMATSVRIKAIDDGTKKKKNQGGDKARCRLQNLRSENLMENVTEYRRININCHYCWYWYRPNYTLTVIPEFS